MLNINWISGLTCGIGALARSFKGAVKAAKEKKTFDIRMTIVTAAEGAVIGIVTGALTPALDPILALLLGYNGTNMLDGFGLQFESNAPEETAAKAKK
jgi:hypothetical protein